MLWADIDDTSSLEELQGRISAASLSDPTLVVSSGNGLHVYWKLESPFVTNALAHPVTHEWHQINDSPKYLATLKHPDGDIPLHDRMTGRELKPPVTQLTEEATEIQGIVNALRQAVSGDSTHDLSRLLRLPGTLNRKNQRNGTAPKECVILESHPEREYSLCSFRHLEPATSAPRQSRLGRARPQPRSEAEEVRPSPGSRHQDTVHLSGWREEIFESLLEKCEEAAVGTRSERDFRLCCFATQQRLDEEEVWQRCSSVGKFEESGREYFDLTWSNAAETTDGQHPLSKYGAEAKYNSSVTVSDREGEVNREIIARLAKEVNIFSLNGQLVEVIEAQEEPWGKRIRPFTQTLLRERITNVVKFEKVGKNGELVPAKIPPNAAQAILEKQTWMDMRVLVGISKVPVLHSDGTIVTTNGYDRQSKMFLDFEPEDNWDTIPRHPSRSDAADSLQRLKSVFADFQFSSQASESALLAAILTPFARGLYEGVTSPLFLITAPQAGCGKSLAADAITLIATGNPAPRQVPPTRDEEFAKLITSFVLQPSEYVLFDNITTAFGCPSLDAALTGATWSGRLLGASQMITARLRTVFLATGNNVRLKGDLHRRVCPIRMISESEYPDQRSGFQHADLRKYIQENRGRLVADCLTILSAFVTASPPDQGIEAWGSFEGWSSVVRQALVWLDQADPSDGRANVRDADEERHGLQRFLQALDALLGSEARRDITARELHTALRTGRLEGCTSQEVVEAKNALEGIADKPFAEIQEQSLGRILGKHKDRIVGSRRLRYQNSGGRRSWRIEQQETPRPVIPEP